MTNSPKDIKANVFKNPELSNWTCELFGTSTIVWTPEKSKVPNWWVRFWSKVFFNCKWIKENHD